MLKRIVSLVISFLIIISIFPNINSSAVVEEKALYISTDNSGELLQRVKVEIGKSYYFTFTFSSSVKIEPVCYTDSRRYRINAEFTLKESKDNGLSNTYTYVYTIPEKAENGKDITDLVFFGIKFTAPTEGYLIKPSVIGADDPLKTELLTNSDFSKGLDEWAWGWEAWFAYWEESGLYSWKDDNTVLEVVSYDYTSFFENNDPKMLHIRYESSVMTDDILVQKIEKPVADAEYVFSYNYHFESGDMGGAVYFALFGDDGDSSTLRKRIISFHEDNSYVTASYDDGFKVSYTIKLDSAVIEKYQDFYIGLYFDKSPRMITEFYLTNIRLYSNGENKKNILSKKDFNDMQGWYSHWTEAVNGSLTFGSSTVSYLEYLAWYEDTDNRLFTPEIDAVHYGDTDFNGKIDLIDLIILKKKLANNESYISSSDCNSDNKLSAEDTVLLKKHLIGAKTLEWQETESFLQASSKIKGGAQKEADALRKQVSDNDDTVLKNSNSTIYFVSEKGDYNNHGLNISKSINFEKLRDLNLKSGDTVLFKRGDTFRIGENYSLVSGVSYGTYGSGEKPIISGSLKDYANGSFWQTDDGFLWRTSVNGEFAANMVFNNGEYVGIPKLKLEEVNDDGEFYFDSENKVCYLYFRQRNPGLFFDSIEISSVDTLFIGWSNRENIVLENLSFKYSAKHGMNFISCKNIKITGCELSWIGGCFTGTDGGRYGNGIQFWCKAVNCEVSNNYLYQIYDAALTFQGNGYGEYKNISYKNNLVEYSSMNFEFWGDYTNEEDLIISDIYFTDNILRFAGYNFGGLQRNNEHNQAFVLGWYSTYYDSQIHNFNITKNIFDVANCNFYYAYDFTHMLNITDNTYYQDSNSDYCININENTYANSLDAFRQGIELIDSNPTVFWQKEY